LRKETEEGCKEGGRREPRRIKEDKEDQGGSRGIGKQDKAG
jgi:hypothetical protein